MKEKSILFTHYERGWENEFTRGFKSLFFGFYDLKVWPQSLTALAKEPRHMHCLYTHNAKIWNVVKCHVWNKIKKESEFWAPLSNEKYSKI